MDLLAMIGQLGGLKGANMPNTGVESISSQANPEIVESDLETSVDGGDS